MYKKTVYRETYKKIKKLRENKLLILALVFCAAMFLFSISGNASTKKENEYKYYTSITVNYGDTLWSIADQYMDRDHYSRKTYIAEVKSINHIKDNDVIKEGKMLILPYYSSEYVEE